MKNYRDNFVDAFSKALSDGNQRLSEKYTDIVCSILRTILKAFNEGKEPAYSFEQLQKDCRILLQVCADSGNDSSKLLFIKLLSKLYRLLFEYIQENRMLFDRMLFASEQSTDKKSFSTHNAQYFNIFDFWNVCFFFNKILSKIDIRILRDDVNISELLYNIQVTDLALFQDRQRIRDSKINQSYQNGQNNNDQNSTNNQDSNDSNETNNNVKYVRIDWKPEPSIFYIQQYIGWYLNEQLHNPDITAQEITEFAKSCIIGNNYLYRIKADYEVMKMLANAFLIENAICICGLITAGLTDTARDVFLTCLEAKHNRDNRYYIEASYFGNDSDDFILPSTVFCYLYYLGFWEDEKYIPSELRAKAKKLAKELSYKYREIFIQQNALQVLIDELRTEGKVKFLPRYIYSIMRRFDFRAQKESSYTIVTGNMVKDFCLFSIALFSITLNNPLSHDFDWICDAEHDIIGYLDYIRDERATLEKLGKFVEFTNTCENTATQGKAEAEAKEEHEKGQPTQVELLFDRIKLDITSLYKDEIKKEAIKADEEYKKKHAEIEDNCRKLEKKVENVVREQFKNLVSISDSNVKNDDNAKNYNMEASNTIPYHTVEILAIHTPTNLVIDTLRTQVNSRAMNAYSNLLQEYILLLIKERCLMPKDRNKSDKDYIAFLNKNNFDLLFGARRFFMASELDFAEDFNKKIEKYTQVIASGYAKGFCSALIKKEKLHFYIKNVKVKISDERPYDYRAWGDIKLPFENEDELRVFIANERKVITVQAEIRVDIGNASGFYFE